MVLTTYEAAEKYEFSTRHLRHLLEVKTIKGRQARVSSRGVVWLIEEASLRDYLRTKRKPGPKAK